MSPLQGRIACGRIGPSFFCGPGSRVDARVRTSTGSGDRLTEKGWSFCIGGAIVDIDQGVIDRFWDKVDRQGTNECWEWTGAGANCGKGYGRFWFNGALIQATHISLAIAGIDIPDGKITCHHCDNPGCVNPDHIFIGTYQDNMDDMWEKGRNVMPDTESANYVRAEESPSAKLDWEKVNFAREAYKNGEVTTYDLADMFGVARSTIYAVLHNKSWVDEDYRPKEEWFTANYSRRHS